MARPQPKHVHVNSFGKKHHLMQQFIHEPRKYYYVSLSGTDKTLLYSKVLLDGRKRPVSVSESLENCDDEWVLVFPRSLVPDQSILKGGLFTGYLSLDKTYIIRLSAANKFQTQYCFECEMHQVEGCYKMLDYDCGAEDRERYRDTGWFEIQHNIREAREEKKNTAFPV
ncbi:hypothetical protein OM416_19315 [Paenibacillus sp. LS1]|uniref:hypothetical protein n=1 Tax=Paenibacillus sp. LS1 TaxID=2992120 RepID=UPI0022327F96|nr:hypothetical protein [Paenibacillus sp. LS1]MCW3793746.1 hypothetical protein [Paenibacillus sp. LS1]